MGSPNTRLSISGTLDPPFTYPFSAFLRPSSLFLLPSTGIQDSSAEALNVFIPEILLLLKRPENSSSPPLAHRPGGFVYLPDGFCSHLATHSSPNQTEPPAQDHVLRSLTHTQLSVPHSIKTGAGLLLTGRSSYGRVISVCGASVSPSVTGGNHPAQPAARITVLTG